MCPRGALPGEVGALRRQLKGGSHTHSGWSDGGSSTTEMAEAASEMGHQYMVLTDHSLPPDQAPERLARLAALPRGLARFRSLSGIEVDLLDDGSRDEDDNLWGSLDVVVASGHSKLRMGSLAKTQRMVTAVQNSHTCGCQRRLVGDR